MNYLNKKRLALMRNKKFKGYIRRVSGYPLTLTDCMNDNLISCKIYGADGGVGDKTANLFDISKSDGFTNPGGDCFLNTIEGNTLTATCLVASCGGFLMLGRFPAGKYYVSVGDTSSSRPRIWINNKPSGLKVNSIITITEDNSLVELYEGFHNNTFIFTDIQITKSDVPIEYEPYGYRIPITVTGENEEQTVNAYAQNPVNADETLDIAEIQPDIPLYKGTNEITIGTSVPPSDMEVKYYADKEG